MSYHVPRLYDKWLLGSMLLLVGLGTLMIYSSTVTIGESVEQGASLHYFRKHVFTMFIGFAVMTWASRVDISKLRVWSPWLVGVSFVLLVMVFMPEVGVRAGNARRWIKLWPSTFQPSELVKLAMVIFVSAWMASRRFRHERFSSLLAPLGICALFGLLLLNQPDFGSTVTLGLITLGLLFVGGARPAHLGGVVVAALPVMVYLLSEPYRLKRIQAFLDPWKNARDGGFQLVQSFIALGSGGLTGVGLGKGRQKLDFLPEMHTDFIFSNVGEELGFFIAAGVVALFAMLFVRGLMIATSQREEFTKYLAFGITLMIGLQAMVNFFVVTGLAPTKGLPLPFISYGGSSLMINMAAVGLLLNLSRRPVEAGRQAEADKFGDTIKRKKAFRNVYGGVQR